MSTKIMPPSELLPVPVGSLKLGMELQTPLYDEGGNLLLAKHQIIDTPTLLHSLREHPALFTDEASLRETARAVMASFNEAQLSDSPLSRLHDLADQRLSSNNPSPEVTQQAQQRAEAEALARRTLPELWTDLEASLGTVLSGIAAGGDAAPKALKRLETVEARFLALLRRDREAGLFLLFTRSVTQFNGYSTLHALVCAALAWDAAKRLPISEAETVSLVRAALTMNVSIKVLQDRMAGQKFRPTQEQMLTIDAHSRDSMRLLHRAGVTDPVWLSVVGLHHDDLPPCPAINNRPTAEKLAKVLQVIDRYSAAMSPRGTRAGRESPAAVKAVLRSPGTTEHDEVGLDLIRNLGLYPPGTFVQLSRGDAAVVLRRGAKLNEPVVASVLNKHGEPVLAPRMFSTEQPEFSVKAGLSGSDIKVRLNEVQMLRHLSSSRIDLTLS